MRSLARLSTERPDPRTRALSRLDAVSLTRLLVERQGRAFDASRRAAPALARAVAEAGRILMGGGRIILVGAGTSGRLAVQEAAECIPTFGRAIGRRVVGVIAGGARALTRPAEGAEDDSAAGRAAMRARRIGRDDLAVGISASGGASFVRAALAEAKRRGALTAFIACNRMARPVFCDLLVVLDTGPEPVAGSTRMKAGTATKIALNTLTTGAMTLAGRVRGNRMTGLVTTSKKLRQRAIRLVTELGKVSRVRARSLLVKNAWSVERCLQGSRR